MTAAVRTASRVAVLALTVASCSTAGNTNDATSSAPSAPTTATAPEAAPDPGPRSIEVALQRALDDWFGASTVGGAVAAIGLPDGTVHVATIGDAAPGVWGPNIVSGLVRRHVGTR